MIKEQNNLVILNDINVEFDQKIQDIIKQARKEREEGLFELGNSYLKQIKQYDLLNNLISMDLVNNLSDQKLYDLFGLMVIDLEIRMSNQANNLITAILNNDSVDREKILTYIVSILKEYKHTTNKNIDDKAIAAIICAKLEQKFLDLKKLTDSMLGDLIPIKLLELMNLIKDYKDLAIKVHLSNLMEN